MKAICVERIINRRRELGWSQERLASEVQLLGLDMSRSAIKNLENGDRRLDPNEINYFAAALRTDPAWLLEWDAFINLHQGD